MSVHAGSRSITDGLVLDLDGKNTKSYLGSGTIVNDISSSNNSGTMMGTTTFSATDGGFNFAGAGGNYILVPTTPAIQNVTTFTVDIWFQSTQISTEQSLFAHSISGGGTCGWHIEIYTSKIILQSFPGGGYTASTQTLLSNTVYNVQVTYNNGAVSYYLNTAPMGTASNSFTPSTSNIFIGAYSYTGAGNYPLYGKIYGVKFYNRVLSSSELTQNYNAMRSRFGL